MKIKPDFFIIGAPKAGTTAICAYLRQHPNVCFSKVKEPHYFNNDFSHRHTVDLKAYEENFMHCNNQHLNVGEGSVFYLSSKTAVSNILNYNPRANFIVMLRNPVDLAYACYSEAKHSHGESLRSFKDAWKIQERRMDGFSIPKGNLITEALQYRELAMLGSQVQRLQTLVDKSRIHYVIFDDLKINVAKEYSKILKFLNLPPHEIADYSIINANKAHRSRSVKLITNCLMTFKRKMGIRKNLGLGLSVLIKLNTVVAKREPLNSHFEQLLYSEFHEDVELLSSLLGKDLVSRWSFKKTY